MEVPLYQVDAFTDQLFAGNPAAVMPLEAWLSDELLQNIAAENNLSETAFYIPSARPDTDFDLRWFTPTTEVDLCGHATLATAHALLEHEGFTGTQIRFWSNSGPLFVSRSGDMLELDFPARPAKPIDSGGLLATLIGANPEDGYEVFDAPKEHVIEQMEEAKEQLRSIGNHYALVVLPDEASVRKLSPRSFSTVGRPEGIIATALADSPDLDFVSRFFAPNVGVPEDPVTGSAHCTSAPYWAERLGKTELRARQISERGGDLLCRVDGDRVHIGGHAVTYLQGVARIPDA